MTAKYFSMITMTIMSLVTMLTMNKTPKEEITMIEWNMIKFMSMKMEMSMMMDKKSMAFSSCVLLITAAVILYSNNYMMESKKKTTFMKLIVIFIMSMMILILSPNMISMMMGWEGLGMTSFILIMFYQNKKSLNSGFYTMMMNRVGDIMLLMGMLNMMNSNSWTFSSEMFNEKEIMMMTLVIAAFSKSAQIPFSSWLTEAMAAPTPISALVHSSTLVTAGIMMFIRFEHILKYKSITSTIFMVSMTTLLMASMNSMTEWDIKKIVALSTLSQLSIMFITISMNLFNLAMFHLLVHATFKALIFLCASSFIAASNTQDMRKMNMMKAAFTTKLSFNISNLTLCGFPFLSSFYSKEMIMEMMIMKKMNMILAALFMMCMMMTLFYSFKMMMFINQMFKLNPMMSNNEKMSQKTSKIMLLVPSVVYGNKMNWTLNDTVKIPHMETEMKLMPIMMMISTTIIIKSIYKINSTQKKMKNNSLIMMNNYMWFMKNLTIQLKKKILTSFYMMFKTSEKMLMNKMILMKKNAIKKMTKENFKKMSNNPMLMNLMIMMTFMTML